MSQAHRARAGAPSRYTERMFEAIEARRAVLDERGPLDADVRRKLDEVFEPCFIYNSNALEGNTLTLGDTIYLLQERRAPAGKTIDELLEVTAHQGAYRYLQEAVRGGFKMSEKLIREFHELLTGPLPENQRYGPGRYKTRDNQVRLPDGSLFPYVSHVDTAAAMAALVSWYDTDAQRLHPVEAAAMLHYRFILIHPFLDGNGRTARLLANFVLLGAGYLMALFRADERRSVYLDALRAVDTSVPLQELRPENPNLNAFPFVSYLEQELLSSYDLALDVIEGRQAVTPADVVRRFQGLETATLQARGLAEDDSSRRALLNDRVSMLTELVAQTFAESFKNLGNDWKDMRFASYREIFGANFWSKAFGGGASSDSIRTEALGLRERRPDGTFGRLRILLERRPDSSRALVIPFNACELLTFAEPHRMILASLFRCGDEGGSFQMARMDMPLNPELWRSTEIRDFVVRQVSRFLASAEDTILAANARQGS